MKLGQVLEGERWYVFERQEWLRNALVIFHAGNGWGDGFKMADREELVIGNGVIGELG
jgi:hypothetical protein